MRQYIGVTGFTTIEQVEAMTESLKGTFGMYGILMHPGTLAGIKHKDRWPNVKEIPSLIQVMPKNSLRTLHWCDNGYHHDVVLRALEACGGDCNAIQLNIVYPPINEVRELKERLGVEVIFQIEAKMFESPITMSEKLAPYKGVADYVIIDASMGAGIKIDAEVSRNVAIALKDLEIGIVFAGGLRGDRVREISELIREFNASIDAEGQLMESGVLNIDKMVDYIKAGLEVKRIERTTNV